MEWVANVYVVIKSDKEPCLCTNFRPLNNATEEDIHPPPLIDDVLDTLVGSEYYLIWDFKKGFW